MSCLIFISCNDPNHFTTSVCREDEEKLFSEFALNMYKQFRDKAASSRSMSVSVTGVNVIQYNFRYLLISYRFSNQVIIITGR